MRLLSLLLLRLSCHELFLCHGLAWGGGVQEQQLLSSPLSPCAITAKTKSSYVLISQGAALFCSSMDPSRA